ncbi:hypothetical protein Tco_0277340 [Tanacetum coccineum]
MSSPNHATSNIEDAFSSNFPDFIPNSPDYVPTSPGKTYSSSSNNSFGVVPIASPTLSLFHDDPYMKNSFFWRRNYCHLETKPLTNHSPILMPYLKNLDGWKASYKGQVWNVRGALLREILNHLDFDNLKKAELHQALAQITKLQKKQMGNNHKISLARFKITDLEQIIEEIQVRHQADKESLLNAIYELRNNQEGPSDYYIRS